MDVRAERVQTDRNASSLFGSGDGSNEQRGDTVLNIEAPLGLTRPGPEISAIHHHLITPPSNVRNNYIIYTTSSAETFTFMSSSDDVQIPGDTKVRACQALQPPCPRSSPLERYFSVLFGTCSFTPFDRIC